jgi:gentisate 1,2-dioxygenase
MTRQGRYLLLAALLGVFLGYLIGLNTAVLENRAAMQTLQQSRSENQKMKSEMAEQDAHSAAVESNVAKLQAALQELVPSENTYSLRANQSLIVGGGRLTIGLIGSPTNESVTININGKRQPFATGDLINVPVDAQTSCQVRLQSFDMFKALVMATCAVR